MIRLAPWVALAGCFGIDVAKPAERTAFTPFTLEAHDGSQVALDRVLANDHAVLVFYRGHW